MLTTKVLENKSVSYTYEFACCGVPCRDKFRSLKKALQRAIDDLEGVAWPEKITRSDGVVVWEETGPETTRETLESLQLSRSTAKLG